jgi:hypothetical protein
MTGKERRRRMPSSEENTVVDGGARAKRRLLPIGDLKIDSRYQRGQVKEATIQKILNGFNWAAFVALLVGERADGTFWIVDGQQRYIACIRRGETMLPCEVFQSEGYRDEAEVYTLINDGRTPLKPWEAFKAAVAYRAEPHYSIHKYLVSLGLKVGNAGGNCTSSLHTVAFPGLVIATWRQDEDACKKALRVQNQLFGATDSMNHNIHKGIHHLLHFGIDIDNADDIKKLSETGRVLIIRAISDQQNLSKSNAVPHNRVCGLAILNLLNKGRRTNRRSLPEKPPTS